MASTDLRLTGQTPTNNKIFTFSAWVKRGTLGAQAIMYWENNSNSSQNFRIATRSDDVLQILDYSGAVVMDYRTTQVFRDTSAFYNIVVAVDTTNATANDRTKLWVNGERVSSFGTQTTYSLNDSTQAQQSNYFCAIGSLTSQYWDGSMAHVHFVDGTAYDASAFGETDATTGIWKPKTAPSVTYGTNGFFLKFASSGSMGTDSSGNGNNFTVNGTLTQTQDTPSNVFATWNPLVSSYSAITYSNGNLKATYPGTWTGTNATLGASSGKYYWEIKMNTAGDNNWMGVVSENVNMSSATLFSATEGQVIMKSSGELRINNSSTLSYGSAYSNGDIMGIAIDLDSATKTIQFYKNGTTNGSLVNLPTNMQDTFIIPFVMGNSSSDAINHEANFGNGYFGTTAVSSAQSPSDGIGLFEYAVPSGYKALCTKSINAQEYS